MVLTTIEQYGWKKPFFLILSNIYLLMSRKAKVKAIAKRRLSPIEIAIEIGFESQFESKCEVMLKQQV